MSLRNRLLVVLAALSALSAPATQAADVTFYIPVEIKNFGVPNMQIRLVCIVKSDTGATPIRVVDNIQLVNGAYKGIRTLSGNYGMSATEGTWTHSQYDSLKQWSCRLENASGDRLGLLAMRDPFKAKEGEPLVDEISGKFPPS